MMCLWDNAPLEWCAPRMLRLWLFCDKTSLFFGTDDPSPNFKNNVPEFHHYNDNNHQHNITYVGSPSRTTGAGLPQPDRQCRDAVARPPGPGCWSWAAGAGPPGWSRGAEVFRGARITGASTAVAGGEAYKGRIIPGMHYPRDASS
jgi:hypothetical protein